LLVAIINTAGVYAQLVAAHVGERGAAQSAIEMQPLWRGSRLPLMPSPTLTGGLARLTVASRKRQARPYEQAAARLTINDGTVPFIYERYQQLQGTKYYALALRR